jgi:putative transposase
MPETVIKSYKFKIRRPPRAVVARFEETLGLCRELYNAALQERRDAWRLNRVSISYIDQQNQLPETKNIREDLKDVYSQVLLDALRRLDKTFNSFFGRVKKGEKAGFPRFKGASRFDSFCFPQSGFKLVGDKLQLSKIGTMRIRLSRQIEGKIKTCTIKREIDGWFVVFVVESEKELFEKTGKTCGVDVGLENFATLSNGEKIENPRVLRQSERRLKTAQRSVSRKKRGGKNRKKAVLLLRKQHLKIKRQRLDFLHKTARQLVCDYDEIAVEDLNILGMVKNHHLAKSIMDASWATFLTILECKAENAGKRVWKVSARNTSQNCSNCGEKAQKSLSQRKHKCFSCGLELHRDQNAAINIQARAVPLLMSQVTAANEAGISR